MAEKPVVIEWSELSPRKRLSALLEHPQASRVVRSFAAEDLYLAIAELGLEDSAEVVQLASPAQFRTFVDLGGWKKDRIDAHAVLAWLRAARGEEADEFLAKLKALDMELLETVLREFTVLHSLEEDPDVSPENFTLETPDGKSLVEIRAEGLELAAVRELLGYFMAQNPFEATRLLEAIRWELPSELEEHAFRFRQARLSDLGFPEFHHAVSLYSYVDPEAVGDPSPPRSVGQALVPTQRVDYFKAATDALDEEERSALEIELRYLINTALVADSADPGDLVSIRRISEQCRDTLSLGLEHLCQGDPKGAGDAVREHPLRRIFQVGFSLTLKLKFRADRLAKRPLFELQGVPLLLSEEAATVAALRRKRPLRALKVEGAEPVCFRSRKELDEVAVLLTRAEQQVSIFETLLGGPQGARVALKQFGLPLSELGVERLWATLVAWASLEGQLRWQPFPLNRFSELGHKLFETEPPPRISLRVRAELQRTFSAGVDEQYQGELQRMTDHCLARFVSELGAQHFRGAVFEAAAASVLMALEGTLTR